jgi:hypothetical protein
MEAMRADMRVLRLAEQTVGQMVDEWVGLTDAVLAVYWDGTKVHLMAALTATLTADTKENWMVDHSGLLWAELKVA